MRTIEHFFNNDHLSMPEIGGAEQIKGRNHIFFFYWDIREFEAETQTISSQRVAIWRVKPKRQLPETSRGPRYSFTYIPNA